MLPSVTSVTKVTSIDTSVRRGLRIKIHKLVKISTDHHRTPSNPQTATIFCTFYYQVDEEFTFLSRKQMQQQQAVFTAFSNTSFSHDIPVL